VLGGRIAKRTGDTDYAILMGEVARKLGRSSGYASGKIGHDLHDLETACLACGEQIAEEKRQATLPKNQAKAARRTLVMRDPAADRAERDPHSPCIMHQGASGVQAVIADLPDRSHSKRRGSAGVPSIV